MLALRLCGNSACWSPVNQDPHIFKNILPFQDLQSASAKSPGFGSESRTLTSKPGLMHRRPLRCGPLENGSTRTKDLGTQETSYLPLETQHTTRKWAQDNNRYSHSERKKKVCKAILKACQLLPWDLVLLWEWLPMALDFRLLSYPSFSK